MSRTRERYARMMATFWRNPRVRALSDAAIATYCLALSYACDQLNDGILTPDEALTMCARGKKGAIKELVTAGFWTEGEGRYAISNYLEHNESRASLEASREKAIADGKRGGRPKGSGAKTRKGTLSENSNGTHAENETHGDGELTPPNPPSGGEAEDPPQHRPLKARIAAQLESTATPGGAYQLLEMLSALHCASSGAPHIQPGITCSAADRKLLASVIQAAETIGAAHGVNAMSVIAGEWVALIALAAAGELPPVHNTVAYFAKRFGDIEKARIEADAPRVPARILEAA